MPQHYIRAAMKRARYEILSDASSYYAEHHDMPVVDGIELKVKEPA